MTIDPKLIEQWEIEWQTPDVRGGLNEYIAQRAYEHGLEEAAVLVCTIPTQRDRNELAAAIRKLKELKLNSVNAVNNSGGHGTTHWTPCPTVPSDTLPGVQTSANN
jgi:hypothetical protein